MGGLLTFYCAWVLIATTGWRPGSSRRMEGPPRGRLSVLLLLGGRDAGCLEVLEVLGNKLMANTVLGHEGGAVGNNLGNGE